MDVLIIGGTRNMGHFLALELLEEGHRVTVLNRGLTPDELPDDVERLRADRTAPEQMAAALRGRTFAAVVDMTLYQGDEAETVVDLLAGSIGHYIFISTGQVYLVRDGATRPFSEADYDGPLLPRPEQNTYDYPEWRYGYDKRQAEDALARAWAEKRFPFTSLRLPMVNSERDPFNRLYGYILRLRDGGPLLIPKTPDYPLRHVYGRDVVRAALLLLRRGPGTGQAYNISQDETHTLRDFLNLLGQIMHTHPRIVRVEREILSDNGFLPECSPFSERWMSELDNRRSKEELGTNYTPLREVLTNIIEHYDAHPPQSLPGYRRRRAEQDFAVYALK